MLEHVLVSVVGGVVGAVFTAVAGLALMVWSFFDTRVYTGDGGRTGMLYAYATSLALYLYRATDWKQYARGVSYTFVLLFVVTWLWTLLWVGFTHVYL